MWGGWERSATAEQKAAYRLGKMDNQWGLMGQAAELAIMWILRQKQQNKPVHSDEAWNTVARPFLTKNWTESQEGKWQTQPKKYCCLREHYYHVFSNKDEENTAKRKIAQQVQTCISNFTQTVLPRIQNIKPIDELPIALPEAGGDVEHFIYEGVKVYAIPDYAYRHDGKIFIHDWKAGKIKEQHKMQLLLYALWAQEKHQGKLSDLLLFVEYLNENSVLPLEPTPEDMENLIARMSNSVAEMSEYLEDCDREKNIPLPKEEWELAEDPRNCRLCNFYELCKKELEEAPF